MANNVYFGNTVASQVSVNVNNALNNLALEPRATTVTDGKVTAINCPAVQTPTASMKQPGVFGTGGGNSNVNELLIRLGLEADPQAYSVETDGLAGRDLYIYIFDGALEGQDAVGSKIGITITPKTPKKAY